MYFTQVAPGLRLFVLSMLKKKKKKWRPLNQPSAERKS